MPRAVMRESGGHPLARLLEPRWALPLLAVLANSGGERTFRLLKLLGATPRALRPSLDYCLSRGWVQPNPGHGHPLRPEWLLAGNARPLARAGTLLLADLERLQAGELLASKWALPVLLEVSRGAGRFRDLKAVLGATDRALALALDRLEGHGLLERLEAAEGAVRTYRLSRNAGGLPALLAAVMHALETA